MCCSVGGWAWLGLAESMVIRSLSYLISFSLSFFVCLSLFGIVCSIVFLFSFYYFFQRFPKTGGALYAITPY